MSEWIYITAQDFCNKVTDGTHDSPKRKAFGKYLITSKHIKSRNIDFDNAYLISEDDYNKINIRSKVEQWDVLISMIGEYCGFCYIERNKSVDYTIKNVGLFKTGNKEKAEWIYYYLNSAEGKSNLLSLKSGTSQPYISLGSLRNLNIKVPADINHMGIINATLSCLDDKIELNNRINKTIEEMAQAIFKRWFVDFEFPNEDGQPYRSSGGAMQDSELGEVPQGWRVCPVEYLAEKVAMGPFGSNIKVETFVYSGVPIISGNHLRGLYLDEISYNYITEEHANKLSNSLVRAGDIIFTHAGNIGQVALIPDNCEHPYYIISQRQFYLRCNKEKALPEYINYFFHSREGQGKLLANATQTGVPSIARPSSHLKSIVVPLPPITTQLKWLEIIKPMLHTLNHKKKESKTLTAIRDALLPKLINGEIHIPLSDNRN